MSDDVRYCPRCGTRRARPGKRCGVCSCPLDLTPDEVARRYPPLPGDPRIPAAVRTTDEDPHTSHEVASDDAERKADRWKD